MIAVGRYRLEGPVYTKDMLKTAAGVYVVLDDLNGRFPVLDVGESENVRSRILWHDRETCWIRNRQGRLCFAALYLPGSTLQQRAAIESELRQVYAPTCGVR